MKKQSTAWARLMAAVLAMSLMSAPATAAEKRDDFPPMFTMSPTGVNLQSGAFSHSKTDLSIGPLSFERSWGLLGTFFSDGWTTAKKFDPHAFGGWRHNQRSGVRVFEVGSGEYATVFIEGLQLEFQLLSGVWTPSVRNAQGLSAIGTTLTFSSNKFTLIDRGGNIYRFMSPASFSNTYFTYGTQVLEEAEFADGVRRTYIYNTDGMPRIVKDSRGYALVIDYSSGLIATVCGYNTTITLVDDNKTCSGADLKASYSYTAAQLAFSNAGLTGITDTQNKTQGIVYTDGLVSCIRLVDSSTCAISNIYGTQAGEPVGQTKPNQVRKQTTATGDEWTYSYDNGDDPDVPIIPGQPYYSYAIMSGPDGFSGAAQYDRGYAEWIDNPSGRTYYLWNGIQLAQATLPSGVIVTLTRDNRQNILSKVTTPTGTGLTAKTVTTEYYSTDSNYTSTCTTSTRKLCSKPVYQIDERGGRTDFAYDAAHGMVTVERGPDLGSGLRATTFYDYVQVTPWLSNGAGYVAESPIWVLSQKRVCKTSSSSTDCASGDAATTNYDYGAGSSTQPNNLLLRGIVEDPSANALRTCYLYDWQGNKIAETKPRASLTSCS